jgi:hypothetical protein
MELDVVRLKKATTIVWTGSSASEVEHDWLVMPPGTEATVINVLHGTGYVELEFDPYEDGGGYFASVHKKDCEIVYTQGRKPE